VSRDGRRRGDGGRLHEGLTRLARAASSLSAATGTVAGGRGRRSPEDPFADHAPGPVTADPPVRSEDRERRTARPSASAPSAPVPDSPGPAAGQTPPGTGAAGAHAARIVDVRALLRRRGVLIAVLFLVNVNAFFAGALTRPGEFRSEVVVVVAPPPPAPPDNAYVPAFATARIARDVMTSRPVAELVSRRLGGEPSPGEVVSRTSAVAGEGWQTLTVRYDGTSREAAERLAAAGVAEAVPATRAVLPPRSQLVPAGPPSVATSTRDGTLVTAAGVGVSLMLALLVGVLVDLLAPRRRR
jgi:hypothetical protein